ncbi:MAG: hypothetical protein RIB43_02675 [Rhodospirillaceae bacterium]
MSEKVYISQSDRFAQNHGHVHRSSGIFYYRSATDFSTTLTLWNHFKHKNNVEAGLVASVRDMSGKLVGRESLNYDDGDVINYNPLVGETFEGSVEIEAFSSSNLKIPFTAIAALYEAKKSVCLLHAYGRVYSSQEIEESRTVPVGREMGWSLRDTDTVRSFCVFHNGANGQPAQTVNLRVRNSKGDIKTAAIDLAPLRPFQTVRLNANDYIAGLSAFLGGREGTASLDFMVNGAFTRMLVANETVDATEFQATHSNFNYADHVTEALPDSIGHAYMFIPKLQACDKKVIVYPEFSEGQYLLETQNRKIPFQNGDCVVEPVNAEELKFSRDDGALPARIVTGLILEGKSAQLPAEISLNVLHAKKPDKRLSWGVCAASDRLKCYLVVTPMPPLKGAFPSEGSMELRAYSATNHDVLSVKFGSSDIDRLSAGIAFDDIFPSLGAHLAGQTGYFTLYSEYGGLICYTMLSAQNGNVSLEHSF